MNFEINNRIKMLNKYSNLDALYGPYNSVEDACAAIPEGLRGQGLTVGIISSSNKVSEYWWNTSDVSDEQLKPKVEELDLTISPIGETTINVEEGGFVTIRFDISGRATIQKGFIYQVVGSTEIFQSEFTNLGKGENSITINTPPTSGVYKYRLRVIDSTGQYAKYTEEQNYIDYEVRYGGISIAYNFTNLDRIQIKNVQSVAGQYFTANITVRDSSFEVLGVYLSDRENINISLPPYRTLSELSDTYLGFNYYIFPETSVLQPLNGKFCYIKVVYTENGEQQVRYTDLFAMLDTESLELVSQSVEKDYYLNFPDYYTFQFQSGISNLSVYTQQGSNSDFTFEPVTVTSYNNFSLRVIPNKIKQNAQIEFNCSYTIDGILKYKTFTMLLGNIIDMPARDFYQPADGGSVTLSKVVEATEEDILDGQRYYKIENDFTSEEYNTCAFIVDVMCKIGQTNSKGLDGNPLKLVQLFLGDVEIGYITEDIINCKDIITDTPINEWVQIGLGYNIEETITRNNQSVTAMYHTIYINGMVVKNIRIDDGSSSPLVYDPSKPITIKLQNGIGVSKCFIYYKNNAQPTISPKADVYSIIYTNYLAHNPRFEEPADLPVLKLRRITDNDTRLHYFDLLSQLNEDIKHLTTFGTIGLEKAQTMNIYDPKYYDELDTSIDRDSATLFRQHVDIKKPAQKEYGVLCEGQWMVNGVNLLQDCIIEVHTQGTSTLVYAVPNFKFTFWHLVEVGGVETLERFEPTFIQKGDGLYYEESVYTAKADFMDSSHLNNTPTCNFYNNLIQELIADDRFADFEGSPSAQEGNLDAIMGFPIVLEISDNAQNMSDIFMNIGSFMLNIDKTGDSLGFDDDTISLEGTSNDNETGAAGRFIIPDGVTLKNYLNQDGTLNESEINADYTEINTALLASGKKLDLQAIVGGLTVENHPYVKWCKFLSDGLEYRYPDSDIYKTSTSGTTEYLNKILKLDHFKKIYKMWIWVCNSENNQNYKQEFENHFDLDYCMLYFIQLMIFGQTDNLGKNAMFDTWDGEHWYPRPYDLDSLAGLDNNGNDNIAPFVEIKPEFSLNYDPNYTEEELAENYLLESSLVPYGSLSYKRYHYSSNSSRLWITFYKNYKNEIESFYGQLRSSGLYNPEVIIDLCELTLINKLGVLQYNQDFNNKYVATTDQKLAYGNRWIKFKKWIRQRFAFCDSYFGASDTANYNLILAITYDIDVQSPQYVIQTYQANSVVKFVISKDSFSSGSAAATKLTLRVNQDLVLNTSLFKYVSYQSGPRDYSNIISLDVSQNKQITNIESLVGDNLPNLKELNINSSSVSQLNNIPSQLRVLNAENVNLSSIQFPENCVVERISLKNSTISTNISFNQLPNLKYLDLTNCTITGNIVLANLPAIETFIINNTKFQGNIIIQNNVNINRFDFSGLSINGIVFDGNDIDIKILNFNSTTFTQDRINLDAISKNVEEIYFNNCKNLKHIEMTSGKNFLHLNTFSLYNSSITSLGVVPAEGEPGEFDASHFNNIACLKKVSISEQGLISYSQFTFENTQIVTIRNIDWNGVGTRLFYACTELEHIYGTLNFVTNTDYAFWRCAKLVALPTVNIGSTVVSARYMFAGANLLTYNDVENVVERCVNVEDFLGLFFCKKFVDNTNIRLSILFLGNSVVKNLSFMLCTNAWSQNIPSVTNTIEVSGKIPSTVENTSYMLLLNNVRVPYDILSDASALTNSLAMFAYSTIEFYIPSGSTAVLPSYIDPEDQETTITLTNAVDASFFPVGLKNINSMFEQSNILIIDSNVFSRLENLETCVSCFRSAHGGKFDLDVYVDTLWRQCPKLTSIAACFENIINVSCNAGLLFNNAVDSTKTIDISGLFGLGSYNANNLPITINFGDIVPKLVTDDYHSVAGNTTRYNGVFQGRTVYLTDSDISILNKVSGVCRKMFCACQLHLDNSVSTLDLSNVTNAYQMFEGCATYLSGDNSAQRVFVNILLPTQCSTYYRMFANSTMLFDLPSLRSASVQNTSYMFSNCVINRNTVTVPYDYFQICKNNISDVSYMFANNIYITDLAYNENTGLFSGCVNLQNVGYMFYGAWFLHKGVPNNIFGSVNLPKITSLLYMFGDTSIFFDVEDELIGGKKWFDSNTIAPLINLQSIQGLFYRMRIGNNASPAYAYRELVKDADDNDVQVISQDTFAAKDLLNISQLFYRTSTVKNIPFAFRGFSYAQDAFCDSLIEEISESFITNTDNLWNVRNVARMFGMRIGNTKSVTNLGLFVNNLKETSKPVMTNMAGNLTNTDITDPALLADFDLSVDYGHSLTDKPIYS